MLGIGLLLAGFPVLQKATAGPTERALKKLGNAVGKPKFRPPSLKDPKTTIKIPNRKKSKKTSPLPPLKSTAKPKIIDRCVAKLKLVADAAKIDHPKKSDVACVIPNPVLVKGTKGENPISFTKGLILDCTFALAYSKFFANTIQPIAKRELSTTVKKVNSGQGYVCRRRNNKPDGKLSEHAFGNGVDVIGLEFRDKSKMAIRAANLMPQKQARFFKQLRKSSCTAFTTVLGPGSNAAHATHLHFDLGRSKGRKNPYRICE